MKPMNFFSSWLFTKIATAQTKKGNAVDLYQALRNARLMSSRVPFPDVDRACRLAFEATQASPRP